MRLTLFCIRAPNAPITIDIAEMIAITSRHECSCGPNVVNITCASRATAAIFGADEKNPKSRAGVQAPDEYVAKYADANLPENLKRYYAAVTCMDDAIGDVLALLRELKRVETEAIFQKRVFFVQSLGFITPTEARQISFEESLRFERVHE